jgi:hypothetical protein
MKRQLRETAKKGAKKGRFRLFFLNFGRLILDGTKLSFGSLVLGTIIKGEIPQATLLGIGIIASAAGALCGIILVTLFEEK